MGETTNPNTYREVTYIPPEHEVLEMYAQSVCDALRKREGDENYRHEVTRGFTEFIKTIVQIQTKYLNRTVVTK